GRRHDGHLDRLGAVAHGNHMVAARRHERLDHAANRVLILDDENVHSSMLLRLALGKAQYLGAEPDFDAAAVAALAAGDLDLRADVLRERLRPEERDRARATDGARIEARREGGLERVGGDG